MTADLLPATLVCACAPWRIRTDRNTVAHLNSKSGLYFGKTCWKNTIDFQLETRKIVSEAVMFEKGKAKLKQLD